MLNGGCDAEDSLIGNIFEDLDHDYSNCVVPTVTIPESEVRDEFLSKDLATELYDIMNITHKLFQTFKITYWLTGGSIIGQQRHGGIIPWDDDIDICVFMDDRDKLLSNDVQNAFRANNLFIGPDLSFNMVSDTLWKVYRNTVSSKAHKSGKVPYPFCDIFFMKQSTPADGIHFSCGFQSQHVIYPDELFPLQLTDFGPIQVYIPANPIPQLNRGYGSDWSTHGQIHQRDHVTKQGKGGPLRKFEVHPFLNLSAEYDPKGIRTVILH